MCWPRPRPNKTNFPDHDCRVAAFFHCTRAGFRTTRAGDAVPLREFGGADPENGRHRPACRRDNRTMSRNCEEAIPIFDRSKGTT